MTALALRTSHVLIYRILITTLRSNLWVNSALQLQEPRPREIGELLKFTPLGKKVPFHMAGQAVGMERVFFHRSWVDSPREASCILCLCGARLGTRSHIPSSTVSLGNVPFKSTELLFFPDLPTHGCIPSGMAYQIPGPNNIARTYFVLPARVPAWTSGFWFGMPGRSWDLAHPAYCFCSGLARGRVAISPLPLARAEEDIFLITVYLVLDFFLLSELIRRH